MQIPASLERLVEEFSRFPGIGRKTAQRVGFRGAAISDLALSAIDDVPADRIPLLT